jgi:uroporphyrinogen decarboxylase
MRQAGRSLPEYRQLRERYSFLELVQTPELAAEVTLQPVRRFGFDAAIIFSDILVMAEALGQRYSFGEQGGMVMEFALRSEADVGRLNAGEVAERLAYVGAALRLTRRELSGTTALIGFAGSPWTVANFMVEGGSARRFTKARHMAETEPAAYGRLAQKLTAATVDYLNLQLEAGADAIQLFDTLGHLAGPDMFEAVSGRWLREIVAALAGRAPIILFAKGVNWDWPGLAGMGANVLGADSAQPLADVRRQLPEDVGVQGNLDPELLSGASARVVADETRWILEEMRGLTGHIFNLGHGVPPDARLENLEALVDTVRSFR